MLLRTTAILHYYTTAAPYNTTLLPWYTYIRIYIHTYVPLHIYISTSASTSTPAPTAIHIHIYMHIHMHIHIYIHLHLHSYTYTYSGKLTNISLVLYIYAYITRQATPTADTQHSPPSTRQSLQRHTCASWLLHCNSRSFASLAPCVSWRPWARPLYFFGPTGPIGLHPYFSMTKMEGIRPGHILFGPEICPRLRIWGLFGMIPSFWCGI
jgi:hypothetical protein